MGFTSSKCDKDHMQTLPSRTQFQNHPGSASLLNALETQEGELGLSGALIYHSFPLYKDEDGNVIMADCLIVSPEHGVLTVAVTDASANLSEEEVQRCRDVTEQVPP